VGREQVSGWPAPHLLPCLTTEELTLAQVHGRESTTKDGGKEEGVEISFSAAACAYSGASQT